MLLVVLGIVMKGVVDLLKGVELVVIIVVLLVELHAILITSDVQVLLLVLIRLLKLLDIETFLLFTLVKLIEIFCVLLSPALYRLILGVVGPLRPAVFVVLVLHQPVSLSLSLGLVGPSLELVIRLPHPLFFVKLDKVVVLYGRASLILVRMLRHMVISL